MASTPSPPDSDAGQRRHHQEMSPGSHVRACHCPPLTPPGHQGASTEVEPSVSAGPRAFRAPLSLALVWPLERRCLRRRAAPSPSSPPGEGVVGWLVGWLVGGWVSGWVEEGEGARGGRREERRERRTACMHRIKGAVSAPGPVPVYRAPKSLPHIQLSRPTAGPHRCMSTATSTTTQELQHVNDQVQETW